MASAFLDPTMQAPAIPSVLESDSEDVATSLETAQALGENGDLREALRWIRRAADAAEQAGDDMRALTLARAAADLTSRIGGASRPPPLPPPAPETSAAPAPPKPPAPPSSRGSGTMPKVERSSGSVDMEELMRDKPPEHAPPPPSLRPPPPSARAPSAAGPLSSAPPKPSVRPVASRAPSVRPVPNKSETPMPSAARLVSEVLHRTPDKLPYETPPPPSVRSLAETPLSPSVEPVARSAAPPKPAEAKPIELVRKASAHAALDDLQASADLEKLVATGRGVRVAIKRSTRDKGLYVVRRLGSGKPPFGSKEAVIVLNDGDLSLFNDDQD